MRPDNVGTWSVVCKVNDHFKKGMKYTYRVNKCTGSTSRLSVSGTRRKYFIGIKEIDWDYAPNNVQMTSGEQLTNDTE